MNPRGARSARAFSPRSRSFFAGSLAILAALLCGAGNVALGVCGPFTDVSDAGFCPFVLEIFTLGITTGTTPTTYDPANHVTRLQMAAFLSRTVDRALQRGTRRAALRQFWTSQSGQIALTATLVGSPQFVEYDGADVWVSLTESGRVSRIRSSDGAVLETWTGVTDSAAGVLLAMGKVFVTAPGNLAGPTGKLYRIDPSLPAGAATTVASGLPAAVFAIAFDGGRVWTANRDGSVSIVTPGATLPWTVTTTTGAYVAPSGILYDGTNIWITDSQSVGRTDGVPLDGILWKLNSTGGVLQTVTVEGNPSQPVFDGSNIWVPNFSSVSVVRASSGAVLATLTGNGLNRPFLAAFDGQRVLLTNFEGNSVSVFKAADLTPLGSFLMPAAGGPVGACSDGVTFWVALSAGKTLARF